VLFGLTEYFAFYNSERPHQRLGKRTPEAVHRSGVRGGAEIVDRFGSAAGPSTLERGRTRRRARAAQTRCD